MQNRILCIVIFFCLVSMSDNSKKQMRQLAEELENRWLLPQGAMRSFVRAHNNQVTMQNLCGFFDDLGLTRLWVNEGKPLFSQFEDDMGFVDMQSFMEELDRVNQIHMQGKLQKVETMEKISYDSSSCQKFVGLVAHNEMKPVMLKFVEDNLELFRQWPLVTTGSTGSALSRYLNISVARQAASGPLGGDQQIGGMIAQNQIAGLFFFTDPLNSHPHIDDVHALTRLCDVYQVPYATNRATALGVIHVLQDLGICWSLGEADIVRKYKSAQSKVIDTSSQRTVKVQATYNPKSTRRQLPNARHSTLAKFSRQTNILTRFRVL